MTTLQSRRRLLQCLATAPMLPMGRSTLAAAPLHGSADNPAARFATASFTGMAAPTLAAPAAMATTSVGSTLEVAFSDGSRKRFALAYHPFFRTGDRVPDGAGGTILAGGCCDIGGAPIIDRSVPGQERQIFSDCPDGASILTLANPAVAGVKGHTVFAVVQFEYTTRDQSLAGRYGQLPSPIAVLTLDQDRSTGKLTLVKYSNVDTAPAKGLWTTCGASLSPWGTHLSSEEYEPDATTIATNSRFRAFSLNLFGDATTARPYHYGHLPEVTVRPDGTGSIVKHYCLGRISRELVQVMPDRRTVLMGDDATNGGLFVFVADKAADLSAGTLYVAKWRQTSGAGPGSATLAWIRLGSATSAEIEALADTLQAGDIFDVKTADPLDASYTRIPYAGRFNWVRLRPGMDKAAAFLETHRYAAYKGGSLGFSKMEGTTVNVRDRIAYTAMSYIQSSMLNGSGDVKVEGPRSGAVYALELKGGQTDTSGATIGSAWLPVAMAAPAALVGEDLAAADALGNLSHPDKIANPDNIKFSEKLRTLFIGEDSDRHVNNFLWAYNVDTRKLSRILSVPAAAESTGLHAVDEVNGWTYIMSNFQHAGDWESPLHDKVRSTLDPLIRANYRDRFSASVGYLTADPTGIRLA